MKHPFAIKHHSESHGLVELSHLEKEEVAGGCFRVSTMAVGEEGGHVSTMMVGEEGGVVTTMALGEEGGIAAKL